MLWKLSVGGTADLSVAWLMPARHHKLDASKTLGLRMKVISRLELKTVAAAGLSLGRPFNLKPCNEIAQLYHRIAVNNITNTVNNVTTAVSIITSGKNFSTSAQLLPKISTASGRNIKSTNWALYRWAPDSWALDSFAPDQFILSHKMEI